MNIERSHCIVQRFLCPQQSDACARLVSFNGAASSSCHDAADSDPEAEELLVEETPELGEGIILDGFGELEDLIRPGSLSATSSIWAYCFSKRRGFPGESTVGSRQ